MIRQHIEYVCDAEGCGASIKRVFQMRRGSAAYIPTPTDLEGWETLGWDALYCPRHTVTITIDDRAKEL